MIFIMGQSESDNEKEEDKKVFDKQDSGGQESWPNVNICLTSGSWYMWICECAPNCNKEVRVCSKRIRR